MSHLNIRFFLSKTTANLAQQINFSLNSKHKILAIKGAQGSGKTQFVQYFLESYQKQSCWLQSESQINKELLANEKIVWIIDDIEIDVCKLFLSHIAELKGQVLLIINNQAYTDNPLQTLILQAVSFKLPKLSYSESLGYFKHKLSKNEVDTEYDIPIKFLLKIYFCKGSIDKLNQTYDWNKDQLNHLKPSYPKPILFSKSFIIVCLVMLTLIAYIGFITPQSSNDLNRLSLLESTKNLLNYEFKPSPSLVKNEGLGEAKKSDINIVTNKEEISDEKRSNLAKKGDVSAPIVQQTIAVELKVKEVKSPKTEVKPSATSELKKRVVAENKIRLKPSLLRTKLEQTRQWLSNPNKKQWSHQILVFGVSDDVVKQFDQYVNTLRQKNINTNPIMVYEFVTQKYQTYSILYGQYSDKKEAQLAFSQLPKYLRKDRPIMRTANGVLEEIRKNNKYK